MRFLLAVMLYLSLITVVSAQNETSIGCTLTDADCPAICADCAPGYTGGGCVSGVNKITCKCNQPTPCVPSTSTTLKTCVSCPAHPSGCRYEGSSCESCGTLICETTTTLSIPTTTLSTTTTLKGYCEWCGNSCIRTQPDSLIACPAVIPPPNMVCVEENGQCVTKLITTTTMIIPPCKDSDYGKNYYVKGTTAGVTKCADQSNCMISTSVVDICGTSANVGGTPQTPNSLQEFYCQDGYRYVDFYECPNGCRDGACLSSTGTTISCVSCPAPPSGCRYEGSSCQSCGKLICETTTTIQSACGNGVCEEGEATYCPPCTGEICPLAPCMIGKCPQDCPSITPSTTTTLRSGMNYRNAHWQCYDGYSEDQGGSTSCKSSEVWRKYADESCSKRCSVNNEIRELKIVNGVGITSKESRYSDSFSERKATLTVYEEGSPQTSREVSLNAGDSTKVGLKTLRLENVGSGGALLVNVDGVSATMDVRRDIAKCGVNSFRVWNECRSEDTCCFDTFSRLCYKGGCNLPNQYQVPCDSSVCKIQEECPKLTTPPSDYCKDGRTKTIYNDKGCAVGYECEQTSVRKCPEYVMCPDGTKNPCYESGDTCTCKECAYHCKKTCRDIGTEKEGWYDSCTGNLIKFDKCGGDMTAISNQCKREIDESGFVKVNCEKKCPQVPHYLKEKCLNNGGSIVIRKDFSGCEYAECLFETSSTNATLASIAPISIYPVQFESRLCPSDEEIKSVLRKCEEVGGKSFINFKNNCKIPKCIHEEERKGCSEITPPTEAIGKECESQGLKVIKDFDSQTGCPVLKCGEKESCYNDVPEKVYSECKEKGGELIVKKNEQGCVVFHDCLTRGDDRNTYVEKVERVPDTSGLLSLALKLDALKIELDKLSKETNAVADYYASIKSPEEEKYRRVSSMFETAKEKVDEIKSKIKSRIDKMTIDDVVEIKGDVKYIKEVMLKDILYLMLSSGSDAKEITEGLLTDCKDDGNCFERAFRICKKVSFAPDDETQATIDGIEDNKCVMKVTMKGNDIPDGLASMTCKFDNYALGFDDMRNEEDFLSLCDGPLVKFMEMKYEYGKTGKTQEANK